MSDPSLGYSQLPQRPQNDGYQLKPQEDKAVTKPTMKIGGGGRFKALTAKLGSKGANDPGALAAFIGRQKYGKAAFQAMAAKGRKASDNDADDK